MGSLCLNFGEEATRKDLGLQGEESSEEWGTGEGEKTRNFLGLPPVQGGEGKKKG